MAVEITSQTPKSDAEPTFEKRGNNLAACSSKEYLDQLFTAAYQELRALAYAVKRIDSNATLNPTALVDEAYLKLVNSPEVATLSRLHFKRVAAHAMRQVLIDAARRRLARKRGGDSHAWRVTLTDPPDEMFACDDQLLNLHEALEELGRRSARQAAIVEYRFFGGLNEAEIAAALGISGPTVQRDWRLARAWLNLQLRSSD